MMILTMLKKAAAIGKDMEEIRAEGMDMKKMMTMALTRERALVAIMATAVVAEWEMKVQTGEPVVMKGVTGIPDQGAHLIIAMETVVAVPHAEWEVKVPIGGLAVIKAVTAARIQRNETI